MPNTIYSLESANLFCGTLATTASGQADSLHLQLTELKLPAMNQGNVDHRAAGAPITIEIDTQIAKLESTFQLVGWNPEVAGLVASWSSSDNAFFAYGLLRDRSSGDAIQAMAYMTGRMGLADPQMFRRGDAQHWNYAIKNITHYELTTGSGISAASGGAPTNELVFWDFFSNTLRIGGDDINSDTNSLLHIPASSAQTFLGPNGVPSAQTTQTITPGS
jgi:phage tail tube protein FII